MQKHFTYRNLFVIFLNSIRVQGIRKGFGKYGIKIKILPVCPIGTAFAPPQHSIIHCLHFHYLIDLLPDGTKGWILTVICSMLLLVAGITFASMVLVGQPALANESLWWWILINLGVMVLLFGYGVKRGIQILRIFSIPKSKLTREPGVVVCDYNISLKKYALYKLWDIRHFSFSLLFIIYICIALCTGHYIVPEEQSLFSPLLIWFLCLIYILIMLPVRLNKIYKRSIAGQTWVEITPEGLTYDKAELKQTFPWEEIAGIALYKTYCFLYDKRGGEFLIVTSDEKVKESLLYYLNTKK
jgi:hypothetical protein